MKTHFDQHLNVKELMLARRPSLVVECGAGGGDNTTKLISLRPPLDFRLVVINDGGAPEGHEFPDTEWINGLSYLELPKFEDGSIDFCLIDTDHNYPTLKWELDALRKAMGPGGIVVMHDTVTFGKNNGDMRGYYRSSHPYPSEAIARANAEGMGMVDAIMESLDAFRMIRSNPESHGAIALEKL